MGLLKFVGAEAGEVGELPYFQTGVSVVTDIHPNTAGARSFKGDGTQTANSGFVRGLNSSGVYVSFRFKTEFASTPGAIRAIRLGSCWTADGVTPLGFFNLQHLASGSNSWRIYLGYGPSGTIAGTPYSFTYTSGTWLEIVAYISRNSGWIKINGTTVYTVSGTDVLWNTANNVGLVEGLSASSSDNTRPMWIDDYCVWDTDPGDVPPSVIARQFYANSSVYNAWATVGGGTKYGNVSETPGNTSLAVSSSTSAAKQAFLINSFSATETGKGKGFIKSGATVYGAKQGAVMRNGISGTYGVDFIRRYNSSDNTAVGFTLSTSDVYYDAVQFNNTQYWPFYPTLAELNATEFGINHMSSAMSQTLSDMWVHAVYLHDADFTFGVTETGGDAGALNVFIGPTMTALAAIAGAGALAGLGARNAVRAAVITSAGSVAADGNKLTNTFLRPDSDIALNGWSAVNAASLSAALDEITADDTDYIQSPDPAGGIACEVRLDGGDITAPVGFWYRASKLGVASLTLTIKVMEGTTERAVRTRALTDDFATYQETLTPAESAAVTNWANVTIRFSAA